mmetsp:Transcript_18731/g.46656  ORF Transcript_18731/g.46656 Transcript_18731/m.46656 type:complete len:214 (-) Transcript_18731:823-1464(-)
MWAHRMAAVKGPLRARQPIHRRSPTRAGRVMQASDPSGARGAADPHHQASEQSTAVSGPSPYSGTVIRGNSTARHMRQDTCVRTSAAWRRREALKRGAGEGGGAGRGQGGTEAKRGPSRAAPRRRPPASAGASAVYERLAAAAEAISAERGPRRRTNSERPSIRIDEAAVVVTVAARLSDERSASSPKKSPLPRRAETSTPPLVHLTSPERMM